MFTVIQTNFGNVTYEGDSYQAAGETCKRNAFEAVIYQDGEPILSYSPISGFRVMFNV